MRAQHQNQQPYQIMQFVEINHTVSKQTFHFRQQVAFTQKQKDAVMFCDCKYLQRSVEESICDQRCPWRSLFGE